MRLPSSALVLALLFGSVGCKSNTAAVSSSDAATSATTVSTPVVDAGAPMSATDTQARLLVDAWIAAQNSGTFSAYEALYAPRFEGIRRSGSQTARLDRARWMKERERMFKQKTSVSLKEIVVAPSHDGADVRFIQTWISDAYRDEGPKRMVLVRDGASEKLKIAREEMLASNVLGAGTLPQERFAFAIHVPTPHLVIAQVPKDEWSSTSGAVQLVSMKEPVTTRIDANASKLPRELAAWTGKKVELFGVDGQVCEGTIGALSIVGRVVPHFGTRARWNGTGDHVGEPKPSPAEIAKEAWDLTMSGENGRLLVGEVKAEKGDCAGALWGRPIAADKPVLVAGKPADAVSKALMLTELRKTKAYAETQARYVTEKEPKDPPKWESFDAKITTLMFTHPTGTVMSISISAGSGCGSFGGTLSAVWEEKAGVLTPLRDPEPMDLDPKSAGDVDGDGKIDLVQSESLLRSKAGKLEAPIKLTIPFLDCGC